jgi:hypothetical protein
MQRNCRRYFFNKFKNNNEIFNFYDLKLSFLFRFSEAQIEDCKENMELTTGKYGVDNWKIWN